VKPSPKFQERSSSFLLILGMLVTSSEWATVYAQTTGEPESTQTWCQNEKDELKNRFTDLILLLFKQVAALDEIIDT
jgi:hypothetical protein